MRYFALALSVWATLLVVGTGCNRGPSEQALQDELQEQLNDHFQDGLFRVARFRRMGSAPFGTRNDDREGLFVYFDAELELERDYSLTAWKGLNLGTLAFVVGATESGISGFRPRGNQAGDLLNVHGRLTYHREDDEWTRWDDLPPTPVEPTGSGQDLRGSGPDALLRGVRDLLARSPETERGSKDAVIVQEMRGAVARIDLRAARIDGKLTFGAGPTAGSYYAFGSAFSQFATQEKLPTYSYASEGSLENGARLQARSLDLGLVQSDVAERLYKGWAEEGIFPNRDLRAVASLWPEAVHLVTLEQTGIRDLADLRNRSVAIGQRGSGTRFNAVHIGLATGIEASELPTIREIGLVEGLKALEAGSIDAVFATEAIPSPTLQAFAARRPDARFLSIDPDVVRQLSDEHFAYYPLTVEERTYPGQKEPFRTLGLACTLMTSRHVSDEAIERVLDLLVNGADELSESYFRAGFVSRETMQLGIAVPLHPAAERYYADRGEPDPRAPIDAK
jgi:TRAP transporter TAXI family solute receptor